MPLTFLKIKKGKERFCKTNRKIWCGWVIVFMNEHRLCTETGKRRVEREQEPRLPISSPSVTDMEWSSKIDIFFWEAKVCTESLACQRVRSGLLLFGKNPLDFSITLDLSTFLFSFCFSQTHSFLFYYNSY